MARRIVERAHEAVEEVERHRRADHADRAPVDSHRGGVTDHPAGSRRIEVGLGPVRLPGFAAVAIEERHVGEAREDLVDRGLAHLAPEALPVDERVDRHEIVRAGAEVAPAQVRHGFVRQPHVLDQVLGQPVIGRRIAARREVAPVQHDPAIDQLAGIVGRHNERSSRSSLTA